NPDFKKEYDALEPEYRLLKAIVEQRVKKGVTQAALATRIGTKQSVIARLESGQANPTIAFLKKVADALDADLDVSIRPRS
ncbi:MAG: helix-turn-helix transcriptional regulator, partial [Clostridia bacterium]|nr:helix-turn-helix transcriptional regulator [Clostridia bacterium]